MLRNNNIPTPITYPITKENQPKLSTQASHAPQLSKDPIGKGIECGTKESRTIVHETYGRDAAARRTCIPKRPHTNAVSALHINNTEARKGDIVPSAKPTTNTPKNKNPAQVALERDSANGSLRIIGMLSKKTAVRPIERYRLGRLMHSTARAGDTECIKLLPHRMTAQKNDVRGSRPYLIDLRRTPPSSAGSDPRRQRGYFPYFLSSPQRGISFKGIRPKKKPRISTYPCRDRNDTKYGVPPQKETDGFR